MPGFAEAGKTLPIDLALRHKKGRIAPAFFCLERTPGWPSPIPVQPDYMPAFGP
jgi:hypothetical protein